MSTAGRDPRPDEAERLAEQHARLALAVVDARLAARDGVDLVGPDLAAAVRRDLAPVERQQVQDLREAAGSRTAVLYSRSGFTRTAVLWADQHAVGLFAYTDAGFVAPANQHARELLARAQALAEERVRAGTAAIAQGATAAREQQRLRDQAAHAAALRAEQTRRTQQERARRERQRAETVLGRSMGLLLEVRLDAGATAARVHRLAACTTVREVAERAAGLSSAERPHAVAPVRELFDEAAAVLDVLTPAEGRASSAYRSAHAAVVRAWDLLDDAEGLHVMGHVAPDEVAAGLAQVEHLWRVVLGELLKLTPPPSLAVPQPRGARYSVDALGSLGTV